MNADQRRRCYNAARRTRRWAEKCRKRYEAEKDLCGMCGVASAHLLRELHKEGINGRIVEADGHAFVMYKRYIIDVTATQFDHGRIVIRKRRSEEPDWWQGHTTFRSAAAFVKHQHEIGWPKEQIYDYKPTHSVS